MLFANPEAIEGAVELLQKNGLVLNVEDYLYDNLSHEIKFSGEKRTRTAVSDLEPEKEILRTSNE